MTERASGNTPSSTKTPRLSRVHNRLMWAMLENAADVLGPYEPKQDSAVDNVSTETSEHKEKANEAAPKKS